MSFFPSSDADGFGFPSSFNLSSKKEKDRKEQKDGKDIKEKEIDRVDRKEKDREADNELDSSLSPLPSFPSNSVLLVVQVLSLHDMEHSREIDQLLRKILILSHAYRKYNGTGTGNIINMHGLHSHINPIPNPSSNTHANTNTVENTHLLHSLHLSLLPLSLLLFPLLPIINP
jgi:hypothetical protein